MNNTANRNPQTEIRNPNVLLVFADQLRLQALGYAGDANAITPRIDRLAAESCSFTTAVSGCPVCSPARASLLTGQYPDRHGVFVNDVYLRESTDAMGHLFKRAGYDTAYIGKWHIDGHGERHAMIPSERRQGFDYWKAMECTHRYLKSPYYDNNDTKILFWDGYDALAQTRDACAYIREHKQDKPFCLVLSYGPPHSPCGPPHIPGPNVPQEYLDLFDPATLTLRGNVPEDCIQHARRDLHAYYAHNKALDDCMGLLLDTLNEQRLEDDTLVVFWSDHGDMLGSQGQWKKQRPWDESILVPLLMRYPRRFGRAGRSFAAPINTPDILPTVLSLCRIDSPESADGRDYSAHLEGGPAPAEAALIACYQPFGQFPLNKGCKAYRGIRTERYTYARTHDGPWLLYDNQEDPLQNENLVDRPECQTLQQQMERQLDHLLAELNDEFLPGGEYMRRWGYTCDETGTPPHTWELYPKDHPPHE